ncbi:MAG: YheC/YheD family protein [Alicyclobacillaceae bacterium]|nr:YheC/YheD family protein [Alicyclobacillaceae bacterium]
MAQERVRVGVATTVVPRWRQGKYQRVFRPSLHLCRMASAAALAGADLVVFAPDDVRWRAGLVRAWQPVSPDRPYGDWQRVTCALPDVIYENVYVHLAVRGFAQAMRREARGRGIPVYNPPLPGKWGMCQLLARCPDLREFLPATELLRDPARALTRIRTWRTAYVKPVGGYGGAGVARVEWLTDGRYRLSLDRAAGARRRRSTPVAVRRELDESALVAWLRKRARTPHLVQQGLRLITLQGRKVDFRVVVQRGGEGEWQVVGVVPKRAAQDGIVTNVIAGGEQMSLEECLRLADREGRTVPVADLERCALRIARRVSQRHPQVGLLGFDLGVDEDGRVWMIEMNPKPARSLMTDAMRQRLAALSVQFAVFLARRSA